MKHRQLTIDSVSAEEMVNLVSQEFVKIIKEHLQQKGQHTWYTREQTASLLGVSTRCLFNWNRKGILCGHTIGNRVMYRSDIVEAALKPMKTD